ncbi:alpha/beta fold hydrolase [Niabella soli]|uniref:alpha/beta fold hydrolase n=1 Tax=Niabella soli TaxID=446683 RepID=UPI0002499D53|nr:alpha/beta hydrolase [Niabella soli]
MNPGRIFLLLSALFFTGITGCGLLRGQYGYNEKVGRYYLVRGIEMYTEVYGKGKPLLMIHGNGGNMNAFSMTVPYFEKEYKVILVDSRAQGRTVDNGDSLSFEMMADDFDALLKAMHIKAAYVLGWSDGGINALELAMRHPNRVIKLASTGANLWPDSLGLRPDVWLDGVRDYKSWQTRMPLTDATDKNDYKIFMLDYMQPNIPLSDLKKIHCPALIIGGDNDLIPVKHTTQIAENIPNGRLWIVPNSGHATLKEHSTDFNKKVDDFFKEPYHRKRKERLADDDPDL